MSGTGIATQERNADLVALLTPDFQTRNEPNFGWKSCVAAVMALPGVRACWPTSSVSQSWTTRARDIAGSGLHLANSGTMEFGYFPSSIIPCARFDGSSYLYYTDNGAGDAFDILGTESYIIQPGLTFATWVYFDNPASAAEYVMSKSDGTVNGSYWLYRQSTGEFRFSVGTGAALATVSSTYAIPEEVWTFVAGRFIASAGLKLWYSYDGDLLENTTAVGVPAALLDSTYNFVLGATHAGTYRMTGYQSLPTLCAAAASDSLVFNVFNQTRAMFGI